MPCYNSQEYVRGALDSLKGQTYQNWELIAVNDGSKDGTLDILEEYAKADTRIKIYSKENGGYVLAVNIGLERVSGDYFLMMGSDDALECNLFEELSMNVEDKLPDIIAFKTVKIKNGENIGIDEFTSFDTSCIEFDTNFCDFYRHHPKHGGIF